MSPLIRVGVLRGGPSAEHEVSLQSGAHVLDVLRRRLDTKYHPTDILIDKRGVWHIDGLPVDPVRLHSSVDVVFNALHGSYGEDGKIQSILETHHIPFTGSGSLGSAVGMNKLLTKQAFAAHGIKSPYAKEVDADGILSDAQEIAHTLFRLFLLPAVVKPASSGSSVGVSVVRSFAELVPALRQAAAHGGTVIIEEFIPGTEATCGVIEGFRGHDLYTLPPVEIRPHAGFFDYEAKYAGKSQEIVPATFSEHIKRSLEGLAATIHRSLGLRHYSRSDFIIHPRRGIYVLEVNTLPGLTGESLMPKALRAVGSDTHELIDHVIRLAVGQRFNL